MDSIEFIKNELHSLFEKLSYLQIRYEYRSRLETHIIHVLPTFCFEKDKMYAEFQFDLEDRFLELFNDENILFITDNELLKIEKPILELGVSQDEIIVEILQAPVKAQVSAGKLGRYLVESKFSEFYEVQPTYFDDTGTKWNRFKKSLTKKDPDKKHQGLFFN